MIWNIISCGIRSLSLQNYYLFVLSLYNILFESGNQIILDLNFTSSGAQGYNKCYFLHISEP